MSGGDGEIDLAAAFNTLTYQDLILILMSPHSPQDALCEPQEGKFDSDTIDDLTWLPLTSLMVYTIAFSIGLLY